MIPKKISTMFSHDPDVSVKCRVIRGCLASHASDLDGREMALTDALERIVGELSGSIVVCRPGKLAYYEGEEPCERYILERS